MIVTSDLTRNPSKMNAFCVALCVAIFVAVQALPLTDTQKEKARAYHSECTSSSGVDQELIVKGRKGEFVDDAKLKEFIFCFFKKAGFQNEAGEVQTNVIKAKISTDANEAVIEKCGSIKSASPQQTAFDVYKCYWENTPKHISLA